MCWNMNRFRSYTATIETYCIPTHKQVLLTIKSDKPLISDIVSGKPIKCFEQETCKRKDHEKCWLKAERIEAKREP